MANKRRDPLPRLNIVQNLNMQQPTGGPGQALYSPALPTSLQQSFHPSFPMNNPLQTPMQPFFNNPPGAPGRPGHHAQHASIQLAAAGIHPPNYMTPVATHFPRPSMMLPTGTPPQGASHPFPNRNRRQLSIGGPPKAVLGGPARKVSPLPGALGPSVSPAVTPAPVKVKKIVVNLPKETVAGEDGEPSTRPTWARNPLPKDLVDDEKPVKPVEIATAESYPPDSARLGIPNVIDVYLPGKLAWGALKHKVIEEKLEKLGVQPGSGSAVPQIHAPHARAASISSPADPALLLFRLNKLHQAQQQAGSSAGNSLSASPQPPFGAPPLGLSPSPRSSRFITNRHGHTMSLAQPTSYSYQSSLFSGSPSPFNPFGPHSVLGSESVADSQISESSGDGIYAPQGRIPMTAPSFAPPPPLSAVGGNVSHVDFIRGFGLDAPQESEEESEEAHPERVEESEQEEEEADYTGKPVQAMDNENNSEDGSVEYDDGRTTVPASRLHSRHVSKLSAALSLRSVGGNFTAQFQNPSEETEPIEVTNGEDADDEDDDAEAEKENEPPKRLDVDPVEEWTGSEDFYLGLETSDDESIGEWSNPSDEERARQQRVDRRLRRRAAQQQQIDQPRRLPNFPRPPENPTGFVSLPDDDIISNPSEENFMLGRQAEFVGVTTEEFLPEPTHGSSLSQAIPLHSRVTSGQHSLYDPAMAHSRHASGGNGFPEPSFHQSALSGGTGRRDSLNPFAKPFVFGARGDSGSWQPANEYSTPPTQMPIASPPTHSRLPSIGKPLNIAAAEFKPGGFSFRLPGAPQMPTPEPSIPLPLPQPVPQPLETIHSVEASPFKVQGREKRQRRGSDSSVEEEGDSFASFKFPMKMETSSPPSIRRHRSGSSLTAPTHRDSNSTTQPFTFAGFSAVANNMPRMSKDESGDDAGLEGSGNEEENPDDSGTAQANNSGTQKDEHVQEIVVPVLPKQKRTPIPLDFKHPVSSNTVPAGLFKALVNNDERTRRRVRSRLSSREIFEHMHRPSMDDDDVALIAHKNPRSRLVTDPGERPSPAVTDDVFGSVRHVRRRSSLPDALHSSPSEISIPPRDSSARMDLHHIEDLLGQMLDEKFGELRRHLSRKEQNGGIATSLANESAVDEIVSLIQARLQESATRSLENSQMDARGDLDYQLIKDIIDENQRNIIAELQREIHHLSQHTSSTPASHASLELLPSIEQVGSRTVSAVVEAISELSVRQEAVASNASAREHDLIVDKLVNVLSPMMHSLQNDPIDYDFLTSQLSQAVKPHISQLIDLASDKRETASLIVDKILPHLPLPSDLTVDTDAITLQLITEVRRAIAPIDAFEIKEQVADLVVERLDSRLAVRDKAFNVDIVTSRVTESVSQLLNTLNTLPAALESLGVSQKEAEERQILLSNSQSQTIVSSLTELPNRLDSKLEGLTALQQDILKKVEQPSTPATGPDSNILDVKTLVETLTLDQKKLLEINEAAVSQNKVLSDKLDTLPQEFKELARGLQSTLSELITSNDTSKRELEELRKLNTEYQVQVTKARGSYGQVRVEKDVLSEKLAIVQGDRDRLKTQAQELEATSASKAAGMNTLQSRNAELEEALAKALARLQSADVLTETNQRNIAELEKANKDLNAEKQGLKSKASLLEVESLELNVQFISRERDSTSKALENLQSQQAHSVSQQNNWDLLSSATEKINMVFNLLENADSEEQKELRYYRDHSKTLEDENNALQKRFKDLETKLANSDRTNTTTRQTLTQAQQRSSEWERRAKESEGEVEMLRTKVEQAEQTQNQLEADYQLARMQLEEHEADDRLHQDRANKMRDQITALESKCVLLQNELEKARTAAKAPVPFRPQTNGAAHPSRPDSRASTVYDGRGDAASRRISSYSSARSLASSQNIPEPSVWDSMHAPTTTSNGQSKWSAPSVHTPLASRYSNLAPPTPKARHASYNNQYARAPSPTPSNVSAAPTQGDDGWWT